MPYVAFVQVINREKLTVSDTSRWYRFRDGEHMNTVLSRYNGLDTKHLYNGIDGEDVDDTDPRLKEAFIITE